MRIVALALGVALLAALGGMAGRGHDAAHGPAAAGPGVRGIGAGHKLQPAITASAVARTATGVLLHREDAEAVAPAAAVLSRRATEHCVGPLHDVPGIGRACRAASGLWRVPLATGGALLTHGLDPLPRASVRGSTVGPVDTPTPTASVSDIDCAAAGEQAFRIVYANPTDVASTYVTRLQLMRDRVEQASAFLDAEAQSEDPTRHARIKVRCDGGGDPLVDEVHLTMASASASYSAVTTQLAGAGYGSSLDNVLVFQDGAGPAGYGGLGALWSDDSQGPSNPSNGGSAFAIIYWADYGAPGYDWGWESTLHEMSHNMGAVQDSAPHSSAAGHCIDGQDTMCYDDGGANAGGYSSGTCTDRDHYDCGSNDYFNVAPAGGSYLATHWNVGSVDNAFLNFTGVGDVTPPTVSLLSPTNGGYTNSGVTVTASDDVSVERVQATFDGSNTVTDYSPPWSLSPTAQLPEGAHTVSVTAWDTSGNQAAAPATAAFTVDRTLPALTSSGLGNGQSGSPGWNGSRSSITGHWNTIAADGGAPIVYYYCFRIASESCTSAAPVTWRSSNVTVNGSVAYGTATGINPLLAEDGVTAYKVCVKTGDAAGNVNTTFYCQGSAGQLVDATPPAAPAAVRDGGTVGSDQAWLLTSTTAVTANWTASTGDPGYPGAHPGSGFAGYDVCVATTPDCSGGVLSAWTSVGNVTSTTVTGLSLVEGAVYYTCVRSRDTAGNTAAACSNGQQVDVAAPPAPVTIGDGVGPGDSGWTTHAAVAAHWDDVTDSGSGIAGYQWCVSATTACGGSPVVGWTSSGISAGGAVETASAVGLDVAQGTMLYACARAVDGAGRTGNTACSNGMRVDDIAPSAPGTVLDGSGAVDADFTTDGTQLQGSWGAATDATSGVAGYEACLSSLTACAGTSSGWTTAGVSGTTLSRGGLGLASGDVRFLCVRALDVAGNVGSAACSDAITIDTTPASPPTSVLDGYTGADIDTSASTSTVQAHWSGANDTLSGIAGYEWCVTLASDCTAAVVLPWTTNGVSGTTASASSFAMANASTWRVCVRALDAAGNPAVGSTCSDGATVDTGLPSLPGPPGAVRDGSGAGDAAWVAHDTIAASWDDVADPGVGVDHYEWCVSSVTACGGTPEIDWTAAGVSTGAGTHAAQATGLGLTQGSTWFACARAVDTNLQAGAISCSDGATVDDVPAGAPGAVLDGPGVADITWQLDGSTVSGSWGSAADAVSGVAGYEACVSSLTDCAGVADGWSGNGISGTTVTRTTALASGATRFVCVRALDVAGNAAGPAACSDGVTVDADPPAAPGAVLDGAAGSDIATSTDTTQVAAHWTAASDALSGVAGYEWCITLGTDCTAGTIVAWTTAGISGTSATAGGLTLTEGDTWRACVRASDVVGNPPSAATCSDGVTVVAFVPTPPDPARDVRDGLGAADAAWLRTGTISATWAPPASLDPGSHYEWCISSVTSCGGTPVLGWTTPTTASSAGRIRASVAGLHMWQGTTYFVCVRVVDTQPLVSSATCSNGQRIDTLRPIAPGSLRVAHRTRTSLSLAWRASSDNVRVASYLVYRRAGSRWLFTARTAGPRLVVRHLKRRHTYRFRVTAVDAAGNASTPSRILSGKTRP